jgi:feruloyl esterase
VGKATADSFIRLYMAPGVQHCAGGPGPDSFGQVGDWTSPDDPQHNARVALEQWVEKGISPSAIIATKNAAANSAQQPQQPEKPKMTRPLCPYPESAKYKGTGDSNDAANFVCAK